MPEFYTNSETDLPRSVEIPEELTEALDAWVEERGILGRDYTPLEWAFKGYVTSMLWANVHWDTDSGESPEGYDDEDVELDEAQRAELAVDLVDFIAAQIDDVIAYVAWYLKRIEKLGGPVYGADYRLAWEQVGHDFALTRNGHGAGFWDRGAGELGDRLSEAAKVYNTAGISAWIENDEIHTALHS